MQDRQRKNTRQGSPRRQTSALAAPAAIVWALSAIALLVVLRGAGPDSALGALEVELPLLTGAALAAGAFLAGTTNLLIAGGVLLVTLVPFALGARGGTAARVYGSMALLGILAVGAMSFAVQGPLAALQQQLSPALPGR